MNEWMMNELVFHKFDNGFHGWHVLPLLIALIRKSCWTFDCVSSCTVLRLRYQTNTQITVAEIDFRENFLSNF